MLGTQLRHLLELLDGDVAEVYAELDLGGLRPRFVPVVRVLVADGPMSIREVANAISVTHSAASQTVTQMVNYGLVALEPGADARQRIAHLTTKARSLLPVMDAEWAATEAAVAELDAELPFPLTDLVAAALQALQRRSFRDRIGPIHHGDPDE